MTKMHLYKIATVLCATTMLSSPVHAKSTTATAKEMREMKRQIMELQARLNAMQKNMEVTEEKVSKVEDTSSKKVKITMDPFPKIESADGQYSFKVGGFAQVDAGFFGDDRRDHPSGTTIRRARLNVSGTITKDFAYKFENEFADNSSTITDAYLQYKGLKPFSLTVGQFKEPFGLEFLTSDLYTTFLERASNVALVPDRNIGAAVGVNGKQWTLTVGGFGSNAGTASDNDESYAITARGTVAPIADMTQNLHLHLGIAGSYRVPDASTSSVRYRSRPETRLTSAQAVDTGSITDVDDIKLLGLESAFVYGPFSLQAEYMRSDIERDRLPSVNFDGYYAEVSYFLTGETRNYQPSKGNFEQVKVLHPLNLKEGTWGAWQIMARYSNLNLSDGPISGGEMDNISLGIKWYPHDRVRVMANYIKVDTDNRSVTPNDSPDVFLVRTQFDF